MIDSAIILLAKILIELPVIYIPEKLVYPNIRIRNRSLAYAMTFGHDNKEAIQEIISLIAKYNEWIDSVFSLDGFTAFFLDHQCDIQKNDLQRYCQDHGFDFREIQNLVFSGCHSYPFSTSMQVFARHFFDHRLSVSATSEIQGEGTIAITISESDQSYQHRIGDKLIFWNWNEEQNDFTPYLYDHFQDVKKIDKRKLRKYNYLDCYDQSRYGSHDNMTNLIRCLEILQQAGFAVMYSLKPDRTVGKWLKYAKPDGGIDCIIIDPGYQNSAIVQELNRTL